MIDDIQLKAVVEGMLMASSDPLSVEELFKIISSDYNDLSINMLRDTLNSLVYDYSGRAVELKEVASGWRFQIRADLSSWISKLWEEKPPKYSRAFLETLALIAYRQPITRAEIEEVRGVSVSSNTIKTMIDHGWIKIAGLKEVPGKPALFVTTKKFLDHFNLKSLQELPPLLEFTETLEVPEKNLEVITDITINADITSENGEIVEGV